MTTQHVEPITVLFAFDAHYAQHGAACIASLLRHSRSDFEFLIASAGGLAACAGRLQRSFAAERRARIEIRDFDVPADMHFPLPYHLTVETYLRFWIGDMLPHRSRALYLDPDTIATGPIEPLWQTDLQGHVLGAVPIPGSTRPATHGMPPGSLFFNAGVLLFDLDAWRGRGYRDRCLDYLRRYPERALDGDQDILNLCTQGGWLPLPHEWNVISPFYRPSHDLQIDPDVVASIRRNAKIIHFNGHSKPWNYMDDHPRKTDYLANLAQTEWRDWRPADLTPLNVARKTLRRVLPPWMRRQARSLLRTPRTP